MRLQSFVALAVCSSAQVNALFESRVRITSEDCCDCSINYEIQADSGDPEYLPAVCNGEAGMNVYRSNWQTTYTIRPVIRFSEFWFLSDNPIKVTDIIVCHGSSLSCDGEWAYTSNIADSYGYVGGVFKEEILLENLTPDPMYAPPPSPAPPIAKR